MIPEVTLARLENLAPIIATMVKAFDNRQAWWRGHGDKEWKLLAGIHRNTAGRHPRHEANVCQRFRAFAKVRRPDCPDASDPVGWLFLMQHYGMDTRLLDWSQGLIIALFFAIWDQRLDDRDGIVWALAPERLNQAYGASLNGILLQGSHDVQESIMRAFRDDLPNARVKAIAFQPDHFDLRMMVQLACSTVHDEAMPLEQHESASRFLYRLIIPATSKGYWREILDTFGIRLTSLFPDIQTLALALKDSKFAMDS